MKVAYLANRYPWPSHTFIRREIEGLERVGVEVRRFSIRSTHPERDLVDAADRAECSRTRSILGAGPMRLAGALIATAVKHPFRFMAAFRVSLAIGWRSDRGVLRYLMYLAEASLLRSWLHKAGAEHLHAHFATNPAAVAMLCRLLGGPPYSFTIHGPEPFDKASILSLDRKVHFAAFVAAISDFARSQLCRWCERGQWPKIHVVRCGVGEEFLELGKSHVEIPVEARFVTIGRCVEQKGHFVMIEAAAALAARGAAFDIVLVGDGPLRAELEQAARAAGLQDHVRFTGWLSSQDVRRHLSMSRALILPSFAEGLPIVLMEAMAMRRPVIATHIAGIPELVVDGENGWLVPPGNVAELARAIGEAIDTPLERLGEMGRCAAAAVARKHDGNHQAKRLKALFEATEPRAFGRCPNGRSG